MPLMVPGMATRRVVKWMRARDVGDNQVVWRHLGCGYITRHFSDDYSHRVLSAKGPGLLTKMARLHVADYTGDR